MSEPTIYQRIAAHARSERISYRAAARALGRRSAHARRRPARRRIDPAEAYALNEKQNLA